MFAIFCVAFYYGSHVVSDGFCNFADFMKALMVLIFGWCCFANWIISLVDR